MTYIETLAQILFMEIKLYTKLSTRSRRAFKRKIGRFGIPYVYRPRSNLIDRLSTQMKMSREDVYNQLLKEREFILKYFK